MYAYCANDPINYTDPSGHVKVKNWILSDLIDLGLSALGVGLAFHPLKYAIKQAVKLGKRATIVKEVARFQTKIAKGIYKAIDWVSVRLKKWFKINVKSNRVYKAIKSYGLGKVNGVIMEKYLGTASILFSPGSLIIGLVDIDMDGKYHGYINV